MSYARKLLARGEEVVLESRQHWFVVDRALVVGHPPRHPGPGRAHLRGQPAGRGQRRGGRDRRPGGAADRPRAHRLGHLGLANTEFLVTTRRIVRAEGILNKRMVETSLEKVNDAILTQSMFGRLFGFGDLDILTAADEMGGIEDFPMVADPVDFKVAMLNQKEAVERPDLAPPAYQRQAPPDLVPAEPMPPRAGSDRVTVIDEPPRRRPGAHAATRRSLLPRRPRRR